MGGLGRYHITMLVTDEEEFAIRSMFKRKHWTCLLHVLSDETVAQIYQSGFDDVFPVSGEAQDFEAKSAGFKEIKTEVFSEEIDENEADIPIDDMTDAKSEDMTENEEESNSDERTDTASETDTAEDRDLSGSDIDSATKTLHNRLVKVQHGKQIESTSSIVKRYGAEKLTQMGYLKCGACGSFYFGKKSLRHHYYHVHRDIMPKPSCPVCNQQFNTYAAMLKHKREKQHNTSIWMLKSYQCEACGKVLARYSSLLNHKKYVCGKGEEEIEEMRTHPCDQCGKMFKSERDAKSHRQDVHFKEETVCDICGKVCLHKKAMLSHRRRHDKSNKNHTCNYCGKAFFGSYVLQQHVRTHTNEKPYKCPVCNYTSAFAGNITKHTINVHKEKMAAVDLSKPKPATESY